MFWATYTRKCAVVQQQDVLVFLKRSKCWVSGVNTWHNARQVAPSKATNVEYSSKLSPYSGFPYVKYNRESPLFWDCGRNSVPILPNGTGSRAPHKHIVQNPESCTHVAALRMRTRATCLKRDTHSERNCVAKLLSATAQLIAFIKASEGGRATVSVLLEFEHILFWNYKV